MDRVTETEAGHRGLPHIPALDGVRGVGVAAVLLFHAGFTWARGGYLGVTTFFVLSGFLITALILVERDRTGKVDLRAFWGRRARRLAPALVVLVGLVLAYVALAPVRRQPGLVGDAVATLTWVANWRFVLAHRSYGDLFSQPSPFQHAWSLGVEEQFYLVLPLLAVAVLRLRTARRAVFAAVAAVLVIASTTAAAVFHQAGAPGGHAYYGTDARMAEPLVGVLLALALVGPRGLRRLDGWARAVVAGAGVAGTFGLVVMVATVGERSDGLYRGGFLAAAVASAAVVAASTQAGTLVGRVLAAGPLAALGRISYGVYLFHWPIFLWLTPRRTGLSTVPLIVARVSITIVVASMSYAVVEQPVRLKRIRPRWAAVGWANASVGLLGGLVAVTASTPAAANFMTGLGAPAAPPPVVARVAPATPAAALGAAVAPSAAGRPAAVAGAPPTAAVRRTTPTTKAATRPPGAGSQNLEYGPSRPAPPPPTAAPAATPALKVAVVGDSMADGLAGGLQTWAGNRGDVVVYDLATPGCPLSRGGTRRLPDGTPLPVREECGWWADPASDRSAKLGQFDPDVIVVQDGMNELPDRKLPSWPAYRRPGEPQFDTWLLNEYSQAMRTLTANKAKVVFLNSVCADWETLGGSWTDYENGGDGDARIAALNRTDQAVTVTGVQVTDFQTHLCPNGRFTQTVDGVSDARPDGYHLSKPAAAAVAQRWLGPLVLQAAGQPARLG